VASLDDVINTGAYLFFINLKIPGCKDARTPEKPFQILKHNLEKVISPDAVINTGAYLLFYI
jgi:hypothetical protein